MPGLPDKKLQQLTPAPDAAIPPVMGDSTPFEQPRQPHNLQGLLRFAVEAQDTTSSASSPNASTTTASQPSQLLDSERQEFLLAALQSMSVDIIAIMQDNIAKLQNMTNIDQDEVPEKVEAFESILDHIDNMDVANDFHKINGFSIFEPCMGCSHSQIRALACSLIAELAQNNPYIQEVICECTNVVPTLLQMLKEDECTQVKIKALYALSCITRESAIGYSNFKMHNGLNTLGKCLEHDGDKLRSKAAFLLCALSHLDKNLISDMLALNFHQVIVDALKGEHQLSHEHLLSLLKLLLENDASKEKLSDAIKEDLRVVLPKILVFVHGKEEFSEEEEYCKQIQTFIS